MFRLLFLSFILAVSIFVSASFAQVAVTEEEAIPLGFNRQGYFAYLKKAYDEDVMCYWQFNIDNLVTDERVLSIIEDMPNCEGFTGTGLTGITSESFVKKINDAIAQHKIARPDTGVSAFPINLPGGAFNVFIEPYDVEKIGNINRELKRIVATQGGNRKYIGYVNDIVYYDQVKTFGHEVLGYVLSPYENRVAVYVRYIYVEGPQEQTYKIDVYGSSLNFK